MDLYSVILLGLLGVSNGILFGPSSEPDWNNLRVTWGPSPLSSQYFDAMPRTVEEATSEGFVKISDCDASATATFRGAGYTKGGDNAVVLLYDKNGYIAGIQTVIPDNLPKKYPSKNIMPPFVKVNNQYYLTAYFVQPSTICSTGRTSDQFKKEGTGSTLLIQSGANPDTDHVTIPLNQKDLAGTKWVEGKCFITMGKHYWYNISEDMNCDDFYPVFLLYNKQKLNGFGWAMNTNLSSKRYEHPPNSVLPLFMDKPPKCMITAGTRSTMHVFLTSYPITNLC